MFDRLRSALIASLLFLSLAVRGGELQAQSGEDTRSWSVSALGGLFDWDPSDESLPVFALRADRPTSDWLGVEFGTSLARPQIQRNEDGVLDLNLPAERTNIFTFTVGLQFRYPTRYVEPYTGLAAGFLWRRDDASDGVRTSQTTFQLPAGLKIFVSDHFGLRAEFRVRRDLTLPTIPDEWNFEQTVGVSYTF